MPALDTGEAVVVAVDPGRSKCGIAVVSECGGVRYREVTQTSHLAEAVRNLVTEFAPRAIIVGDGTGSGQIRQALQDSGLIITSVDERDTSRNARVRYLSEHPATGWRRLIPAALRSPDECYDDYVAVLLAERWWEQSGPE